MSSESTHSDGEISIRIIIMNGGHEGDGRLEEVDDLLLLSGRAEGDVGFVVFRLALESDGDDDEEGDDGC